MLKKTLIFLLSATLAVFAFAAQAKTVTIEGQDSLRFSVDTITVQPGEKVTVKLVNNTKLPPSAMSHNWVLLKQSANPRAFVQAAMKAKANDYIPQSKLDKIIAHTDMIAGGESDTVTFTAPSKPGKYPYVCTFLGHFAAGMKGTLVVKAQ